MSIGKAPSPSAAPGTARAGMVRLVAVFVLFFVLGLVTAGLGASLPALREIFALGQGGGGRLVSSYSLGALIAIVGGGLTARRTSPAFAIRIFTALFAAGALTMALTPSWPVFSAATMLAGAGYGGLVLQLNSVLARRGFRVLSFANATFGIGAILGPLAAALPGHERAVFLIAALLAAPTLAVAATTAADAPPVPAADAPARLPLRSLAPFLLLGFLYAGLETGVGAWAATHLGWTGHPTAEAARLAALFWVGLCAGRFLLPPFLDARSPRTVVRLFPPAAGAALLLAALPAATPYAYTLCGFFLAPIFPALLRWIADSTPDNRAANAALLTSVMTGGVLLPALIGLLATPATPSLIPLTIALLAAAATLTATLARPTA